MDFHTIIRKADTFKVVLNKRSDKLFLDDKVLGKASQCKCNLHTSLIIVTDEI